MLTKDIEIGQPYFVQIDWGVLMKATALAIGQERGDRRRSDGVRVRCEQSAVEWHHRFKVGDECVVAPVKVMRPWTEEDEARAEAETLMRARGERVAQRLEKLGLVAGKDFDVGARGQSGVFLKMSVIEEILQIDVPAEATMREELIAAGWREGNDGLWRTDDFGGSWKLLNAHDQMKTRQR